MPRARRAVLAAANGVPLAPARGPGPKAPLPAFDERRSTQLPTVGPIFTLA